MADPARYQHTYDTQFLKVPPGEDLRVQSNWGYTVRVYDVRLTDWPDGRRSVSVEGLHIRKDGQPGAHRRSGSWDAPEPLPDELAAIVEDARPGWWSGAVPEPDWSALRDACEEYSAAYMGEDDSLMPPALDKIRAALRGEDPYQEARRG